MRGGGAPKRAGRWRHETHHHQTVAFRLDVTHGRQTERPGSMYAGISDQPRDPYSTAWTVTSPSLGGVPAQPIPDQP